MLKLSLDFGSTFGKFPISEPVGTDAFAYKLVQEAGRYAKDKTIGGDEVPLTFWNGAYERALDTRTNIITGEVIYELTHGFLELVSTRNSRSIGQGFEAKTLFVAEEDGEEWVNGEIDYSKSKTDELTYFQCNVVQETERAILERNGDTVVNVLGAAALDGRVVAPCVKEKILYKAFPIEVKSNWIASAQLDVFLRWTVFPDAYFIYYNAAVALQDYRIEDSYTPFDSKNVSISYVQANIANFRYIFAKTRLQNIRIDITNLVNNSFYIPTSTGGTCETSLIIRWGNSFLDIDSQSEVLSFSKLDNGTTSHTDTNDYTFTIPVIEAGQSVYIYYVSVLKMNPGDDFVSNIPTMDISANGTSIGIDTIIEGVREIDFLKKGIDMAASLPFNAPDIETGLYKDSFLITGKSFKQEMDTLPFVWNEEKNDFQRLNMDYLITNTSVELAKHPDYYPNIDLGMLGGDASDDIEKVFSERSMVNEFNYEFKQYEKSELAKGTNQSFHTKYQGKPFNRKVQNKKSVSVNKIYDPLMIEKMCRDIIKQTTALVTDDKIASLDCIQVAPGFLQTYSMNLLQFVVAGTPYSQIYLFNKTNSDDDLGNFDWTRMGFAVGSTFYITLFGVRHTCTVDSIQRNLVVLNQISTPESFFSGNTLTKIEYYVTGVNWTIRQNEGFDILDNLNLLKHGANVRYSIKQNIYNGFLHFLANLNIFHSDKDITCQSFVNNGALKTQYNGGPILVENESIPFSDLPTPLLTPNLYKTTVQIDFATAKAMITAWQTRNMDGTIGGFNRFKDKLGRVRRGYVKESAWNQVSKTLEVTFEEKYYLEGVRVLRNSAGDIEINEVGYTPAELSAIGWYQISQGGYVTIKDSSFKDVITPTLFADISVSGVFYDVRSDFVVAMNAL